MSVSAMNSVSSSSSSSSAIKEWLDSASLGKYYQDFVDANISEDQVRLSSRPRPKTNQFKITTNTTTLHNITRGKIRLTAILNFLNFLVFGFANGRLRARRRHVGARSQASLSADSVAALEFAL
jgi:hypothetical protein